MMLAKSDLAVPTGLAKLARDQLSIHMCIALNLVKSKSLIGYKFFPNSIASQTEFGENSLIRIWNKGTTYFCSCVCVCELYVISRQLKIFQNRIARKLRRADDLSLEGILKRENREKENVEMKDRGHIESIKKREREW